jgi:hypothetical protein
LSDKQETSHDVHSNLLGLESLSASSNNLTGGIHYAPKYPSHDQDIRWTTTTALPSSCTAGNNRTLDTLPTGLSSSFQVSFPHPSTGDLSVPQNSILFPPAITAQNSRPSSSEPVLSLPISVGSLPSAVSPLPAKTALISTKPLPSLMPADADVASLLPSQNTHVYPTSVHQPASLPTHSNSAFMSVGHHQGEMQLASMPVATAASGTLAASQAEAWHTVEPILASASTKATVQLQPMTFAPIEPCPITPWGTDQQQPVQSRPVMVTTSHVNSNLDNVTSSFEEDDLKRQSQNLLISSHEDQLTAITQLCKHEMCLLMDIKAGNTNFDDYVQTVQKILSTKLKIIEAFRQHISDFR